MKRTNKIRLTESQLHQVIKESVKKVLRESRNRVIKESKSGWRGCHNVQMIWHGEWSDPELCADGCVANYWEVENSLWYSFLEETGHTDAESDNDEVEEEFNSWLQANESEVISTIIEFGNEF